MEASAWMDARVNIQGGSWLKWGLPEKAGRLRTTLKTKWSKNNNNKNNLAATAICYCGILAQQPNYSHALILSVSTSSACCCALLPPSLSLFSYLYSCLRLLSSCTSCAWHESVQSSSTEFQIHISLDLLADRRCTHADSVDDSKTMDAPFLSEMLQFILRLESNFIPSVLACQAASGERNMSC